MLRTGAEKKSYVRVYNQERLMTGMVWVWVCLGVPSDQAASNAEFSRWTVGSVRQAGGLIAFAYFVQTKYVAQKALRGPPCDLSRLITPLAIVQDNVRRTAVYEYLHWLRAQVHRNSSVVVLKT